MLQLVSGNDFEYGLNGLLLGRFEDGTQMKYPPFLPGF